MLDHNSEGKDSLLQRISSISVSSAVSRRPLPQRIFIPQHSFDRERQEVLGILVKLHLGGEKVPRHLLWHILFKGCRVIDWFLLFEYLCRNHKTADKLFCACLFGVLRESALSRKTNVRFLSQLRPIHKKFSALRSRSDGVFPKEVSLLDLIVKKLNIPQKGLPLDQLLTINDDCLVKFPKPIAPLFLGVGYKDKGSMGPDVVLDLTEDEILESSIAVEEFSFSEEWNILLNSFFSV